MFDNYGNADKIVKDYSLGGVHGRREYDLEEINDVIEWFSSYV